MESCKTLTSPRPGLQSPSVRRNWGPYVRPPEHTTTRGFAFPNTVMHSAERAAKSETPLVSRVYVLLVRHVWEPLCRSTEAHHKKDVRPSNDSVVAARRANGCKTMSAPSFWPPMRIYEMRLGALRKTLRTHHSGRINLEKRQHVAHLTNPLPSPADLLESTGGSGRDTFKIPVGDTEQTTIETGQRNRVEGNRTDHTQITPKVGRRTLGP